MKRRGLCKFHTWATALAITVLSAVSASAQVNASFTAESTSLTVGETGSWTVTVTNNDTTAVSGGSLVVTIPDDFTVTNGGGASENAGPPHTLTWSSIDLAAGGGSASFTFNAHPDCAAGSGQTMDADFNSGAATAVSSSIAVLYPLMNLELVDSNGDTVTSASVGDSVTWVLTIDNSGTGDMVTGADISFTLGAGFSFTSISSSSGHTTPGALTPGTAANWNTGTITAGGSAVYQIVATVTSCNLNELTNSVTADWSDGTSNCNAVQHSGSTSIALIIHEPAVEITVNNPGQIPYCTGTTASITVDNSTGAGPAENFTLAVQGWPAQWSVSNVTNGVAWDGASATFTLPDIAAGNSLTFQFNIDPAAGCSVTDSATLMFLPNYTNECGAVYGTKYFNPVVGPQTWTMESPVSPTVTATKSGPTSVLLGETGLTYTIDVTYTGPTDNLPYMATITDDYPDAAQIGLTDGFTVTDPDGGSDNGSTITWTHQFTASPETVTYTVVMNAPTDTCAPFNTYHNNVTVDSVPNDCRGCPGVITNASLAIFMPDTNTPIMNTSSVAPVSAQPVDVCSDATFSTNYTFDTGAPANWDNITLYNEITPAGFNFVSIGSVTVNGTDYTASLGNSFPLDLTPLTAAGAAAPSSGAALVVTYTYHVDNSEGDFTVHSWLDVPGSGTHCGSSPQFDVSTGFTVEGSAMTVTCGGTPALLSVCEEQPFTITIGGNGRTNYDATVTLDTRGNYTYVSTTGFNGILDASGNTMAAFEPTNNGDGTYTWNLAAHTPDGSGDIQPQGVITVRMAHNCSTSPIDWGASGLYNNKCENGTNPQVRSTSDSDAPDLLLDGKPTFRLNPVSVFAYSPNVSDRIEIVNGGSGPMFNVDVTMTLDTDVEYAGSYTMANGATAPDLVTGNAGDHTVVFHWDQIDPGVAEYLNMDLHVVGCTNLDIDGQLTWGCGGAACDTVNASAVVKLPQSELLVAYHDGETIDPCDLRDATFRVDVDNNGKVDGFNVKIVEMLPPGVTLVAGSSTYTHTDGYGALSSSPTISTADVGGRQQITWDFSTVLPVNGEGTPALKPGSTLRVDFDVEVVDCSAADTYLSSNRQAEAHAEYDPPCNAGGSGNTASASQVVTSRPVNPDISVVKEVRNLTKGSDWTDTEVLADQNDTLEWRVTYTSDGDYTASDVVLSDIPPSNVSLTPGAFSSTCGITSTDFFGTGASVGDMNVGDSCTVTYRTSVDDCSTSVTHNAAKAQWGCCAGTAEAESAIDSVNLKTTADFVSGDVSLSHNTWTTCNGNVTITLTNAGGTALNGGGITYTLPTGYAYDSSGSCSITASDTPPGVTHAAFVCTPSISGQTLSWDNSNIDFVSTGETITITFTVKGDGTYCDTSAANDAADPDVPIPNLGDSVVFNYSDSCGNTDSATDSDTINPVQPDIDINITPDKQSTTEGNQVSWTITLTNEGGASASNITLTDVLGNGFSGISDTQGGSWSGTTGTWNIPGPIAPGGTWQVTITATAGAGSLTNHATVEGQCLDAGGSPNCTYTHDETDAYTAAYSVTKTVDKATANVGELLTYDLTIVYSNTEQFENTVVTDTLDTYLDFVSAAAQGDSDFTSSPTQNGQDLTWNLPAFNGRKVFHFLVTARVKNDTVGSGWTQGNWLSTDFGVDFDGDATADASFHGADNVSTNITEPNLSITKNISPTTGLQAGDTVTITLNVTNSGDGPAYRITVGDLLNDTDNDGDVDANDIVVYDTATAVAGTTPGDFTYALSGSGAGAQVTYTSNGDNPIAPGDTRQFVFTVNLATSVLTGSSYINQATVQGWSLMPSDSASGNTTYDRSTGGSGTDSISTQRSSVQSKAITATSEAFTSGSNLAVGEVATYEIHFQLPAGTTRNVRLYDRLVNLGGTPWGEYVAGSATLARSDTGLTAANDPGAINSAAVNTPVNVDGNLTFSDTTNYRYIRLEMGDITNTSAAAAEYVLTLDVVVLNNAVTNAGAALSDRGYMRYLDSNGSHHYIHTGNVTEYVAEPAPAVTKTASPTSGQGGDTITFTVVIANTASGSYAAPAFDWTFSDPLPADYTNPVVTNIDAGTTGATVNASFTGNTLNGDIDQLDPGESVTITYTADLKTDVQLGAVITNTVSFDTTSLPGPQGTGNATPGASGASNGERNGSGGDNDLTGSDNATVNVNTPTLTKAVLTPQTWYAIGDTETYQLTLGVPAGDTSNFVLTDVLPAGLTYVTGSQSVALPSGFTAVNNPPSFSWNSGTRTLTWDFGNIHKDAPAGTIVVTYDVQVENVIGNQDGTLLTNTATLSYGSGPSTIQDSASITVGEPNLYMEKTPQTSAAGLDAGDALRYRVEFWNNGHTTAYRVNWSDVLPTGLFQIQNTALTVVSGSVVQTGTASAITGTDLTVSTTANTNDTLSLPAFDMAAGAHFYVEFDCILMNTVVAGQTLTNATRASYNSQLSGTDGRDNSTNPGNVDDDDDSNLNNYEESASHSFDVDATINIVKTLPGGTDHFTIGEDFQYNLRTWIIEGISPSVVVSDTLPTGILYQSHSITTPQVGNPAFGNATYDTRIGTGQDVSFDFGDVSNTSDNNTANDYFDTELTVRVANISGNQNGDTRNNSATVSWGAGSDVNSGTVTITVTEPNLVITKTVNPASQALDDIVTFTITVSHSGSTADAYDVVVNDVLPAGLTYIDTTLPPADVTVSGQNLEFRKTVITRTDGSWTFTYRARIDRDSTVGQTLTNNADVTWASLSGATGAADSGRNGDDCGAPTPLNDYCDADSASVTPTTSAFIDAVKTVALTGDNNGDGIVNPGDTLTYTVTLTNTGSDTTGVAFTDTVPTHTTYVSGTLATSTGTADDSGDPNLQVDVGNLASGATVTITFDVTVDAGTPDGTVISNQGSVDSDQTVPEPTDVDGNDGNGDQPTDIPVGDTAKDSGLYCWKYVEWATDADSSGDITAGDTMTYWILLYNTGEQDLTNVTFSDTIPAGLTYAAASGASGGSLNISGNTVTLTGLNLAQGESGYLYFDVTVDAWTAPPATQTYINQGIADSDQTNPIPSDGNGDETDGYQPTEFSAVSSGGSGSPAIDVEKRWSQTADNDGDGLVDPGDEIGYVITISNTGSADANDVRFSDTTPADTTYVTGTLATSQGIVVSETPMNANIGTMAPGEVVTVTFRVTINSNTPDGTVIPNQATVTASGGINEPSDDNGTDSDGKNPTLTPVDTGGGSGAGTPGGLTKVISGTSEAGSSGSDVLVGEVVTFRVTIDVPAGELNQVTLLDNLPAGLAYIPGTGRLARVFDTGLNSSLDPGGINATPSGTFVSLTDGSDLTVSGGTISVALGDLINSDNDANAEQYILELKAIVENIAANQAGTTLTNQGGLAYWNGLSQVQNLTPETATVTVTEPAMAITKSANPTALLTQGGTVRYTVIVTNPAAASAATGYDIYITDALPAQFTGLSVQSITPAGGVSGITDNSSGTTLDITVDTFPADGTLTIVYDGTTASPLAAGTITNTANLTWTSLPGVQGTGSATPGNPGDSNGERTGNGTGPNDYAANDTADVVVGTVNLTKTVTSGSGRYAIGDVVHYQVNIGLPATISIDNSMFSDILDEGLTYVSGTLAVALPAGVTLGNNPADFTRTDNSPAAGQETLALNWGTVANSNGSTATITVDYDVLVDNILSNQDNQTLDNVADLTFDDPGGNGTVTISDNRSVTVGEPHLSTLKTITSSTTNLDAGDSISFQVDVSNDGTTTAYEVVLRDVLPAGLENVTNLSLVSASGGAETPTLTNNGSDWATSGFDIPVGGAVRITFDAQLANSVIPGQQIQNTVTASFSSRDGADANERDGSTAGSSQDNNSDLNNYNDSGSSPVITVADPVQIDKQFYPNPGNTTYTIGEIFRYRLTISVLEGTVNDLVITDTLPADIAYISSSVGVGNLAMTTGYGGNPSVSGQTLTFDLGDVVNPANGNTTDDFLTIDITAQVLDTAGNVDGHVFGNNADLTFTGPSGTITRDYDSDAGTPGVQPLNGSIVEPNVQIIKTANPGTVPPGDIVTFTILLDHTSASTADAYDLEVVDTLPAGLTYVTGSASIPVTVSGQQLTFNIAVLTLAADNTSFTFQARVDNDVTFGATLTNTANLAYTSLSGTVSEERNYSDADTADVTADETTFIDAVKTVTVAVDGNGDGLAQPGDTLEYTVTLTNTGSAASNVIFTDTLPSETTYVTGSLTSSTGTVDASGAPALTVTIPSMADGDSVTITFRAVVNSGVSEGTVISNQGSVDSNQTVPEPTDVDGNDGNGDQPTDITVGGEPPVANPLYATKTVQVQTDADGSSDVTAGDTMRYVIVVENLGDTTLNNVTFSDTIPAGLTYVAGSAAITGSGNSVSVTAPAVSATISSLVGRTSETIIFDVTVDAWTAPPASQTYINQGTVDSNETSSVLTDSNGDPTDGAQETQFSAVSTGGSGTPSLDVEKRAALAVDNDSDGLVDPGDTLTYTISITNTGSADAVNTRIADSTPANTTAVIGSASTSQGIVAGEDPLNVNIGDIAPGSVVTITFQVTVNAGTADGTIIPNQATVSGDNFTDTNSDDNGQDGDGINPTLVPVTTGSGAVGAPSNLTKTVIATSLGDTPGTSVVIGEIVTFHLSVDMPEGTVNQVTMNDILPSGLTYVAGTCRLARTFTTGLTASANPGGINSAVSGTFIPLADGSDITINGGTISLFMGDVINSDNDGDTEGYTLELQAEVANINENQDGTNLLNQAGLRFYNGFSYIDLPPVAAGVTVVEPNLELTKTITAEPLCVEAGTTVSFRLIVQNTGAVATAYRVNLRDVLPPEFLGAPDGSGTPPYFLNITLENPDGAVINGSATPLAVTDAAFATTNAANDTLTWPLFDLAPGSAVTLTYDIIISNSAVNGTETGNTASADYTTLPDGTGRTGADGGDDDVNATLNNMIDSGSTSLIIAREYLVNVSVSGNGTTNVTGTNEVCNGDGITITPTPDPGWHVAAIYDNGVDTFCNMCHCWCNCHNCVSGHILENVQENHDIQVVFTKDEDPVFTGFTASATAVVSGTWITFTVEANDPDGGKIVWYDWDFNGDGESDLRTYDGTARHVFAVPGSFPVSVTVLDDDCNTATSEIKTIEVTLPAPVVLPAAGSLTGNGLSGLTVGSYIVNPGGEPINLTLTPLDETGQAISTLVTTLAPEQKLQLTPALFGGTTFNTIRALASAPVISFVDMQGDAKGMASMLNGPLGTTADALHIAEETDMWQTWGYLSNAYSTAASVKIAGTETALQPKAGQIVDLTSLLPATPDTATAWARFQAKSDTPFTDTRALAGFETFIRNNSDGAATELATFGQDALFIPHIPQETDIFWTGFTFVNTADVPNIVVVQFFKDNGENCGMESFTIGAGQKVKGLMTELFPAEAGTASWAWVTGTERINGIEIYGTYHDGICGFALTGKMNTGLVLPMIVAGDGVWTGIAVVNPDTAEASATVKLMAADGTVRASKAIIIPAKGRYKGVVTDIFTGITPAPSDYIRVESDTALAGVEVTGDLARSYMKALAAN